MDDTNTKKLSDVSDQPSAEEVANLAEKGDEATVASEATSEAENTSDAATLRSSDATPENPFGALKEYDVNPKEPNESKESEVKTEKNASEAGDEQERDPQSEAAGSEATKDARGETEPAGPASEESEPPVAATEEPAKPEPPSNPNAKWYVVHTFAGHENKVAAALKQRIEAEHLENLIFDILVPTQDKIEIRGGKKETVKEKIFPGYILIKMELNDLSWLAVRTTQGVTSFIGAGNKPTPISEAEVATIVKFTSQGAQPTFKDVFMVDDTVKIIDGPFAEFIGKVDSVDKEKGRVRVLVSIFGRETPVELDFLQVQKL